jgi:hypothetical protein
MIDIGIDPGQKGAIAVIYSDGSYKVFDMPTFSISKEKRSNRSITPKKTIQTKVYIDRKGLLALLEEIVSSDKVEPFICNCITEKQQAMPDQSSNSGFTTGMGYGELLMALDALGIQYETISAKEWQKHFGISKDTKGDSCRIAENLFPNAGLRGPRGGVYDGRADAILLCEYGRRKRQGL